MVKEAEANKEAKLLIWEGMAAQRAAIAEWFKESIAKIKSADNELTGKQVLDFLLDSARIETLEKIWNSNAKVIYVNENLEAKNAALIHGER
jgi:regulator of protease activity HflC (stomatin/prohibitin superfamily)